MTTWSSNGSDNPYRLPSSEFGRAGQDEKRTGSATPSLASAANRFSTSPINFGSQTATSFPRSTTSATAKANLPRLGSTPPAQSRTEDLQTTLDTSGSTSPSVGPSEDFDRCNKAQTKLFECRWKIITEQMSQISALVDGMAVLRQEVQHLKMEVLDKHDEFQAKFDGCLTADHHQSLAERIDYTERLLGDSADRHGQGIDEAHKKLAEFQQLMAERVAHSNGLADSHSNLMEKVEAIEAMFNEFGLRHDSHAKDLNGAFDKISGAHNRVQDLEKTVAELQVAYTDSKNYSDRKFAEMHGNHGSQGDRIDRVAQILDDISMRHPKFADDVTRQLQDMQAALSRDQEKLENHEQATKSRFDNIERVLQESMDKQANEVASVEQRLQDWGENFTVTVERQLGVLGDAFGEHDEKYKNLEAAHLSFKDMHNKSRADAEAEHRKLKDSHETLTDMVAGLHAEKDKMTDRHDLISHQIASMQKALTENESKHSRSMQEFENMWNHLDGIKNDHGDHRNQFTKQVEGMMDKHGQHARDLEVLQKGLSALHGAHLEEVEGRDKRHGSVEERVATLEQFFGDSMSKHLKDYEKTKQHVQEQSGSVRDLMKKVDGMSSATDDRLVQLEIAVGQHAEAHSQHKRGHGDLDKKVADLAANQSGAKQAHGEHLASISERMDYIESMLGDGADRHAKELAAHQHAGQELHGRVMSTVADLADKQEKQRREILNPLAGRIDQLEQIVKEVFGNHVNKNDFDAIKSRLEDVQAHSKNVQGAFNDSEAQRSRMHGTLEKRVELLEAKVNDTGGNMARELQVASSVAQEQLEIAARVSSITQNLNRDLESMEAASPGNYSRTNVKLSTTSASTSNPAVKTPRTMFSSSGGKPLSSTPTSRPLSTSGFSLSNPNGGTSNAPDISPRSRSDRDLSDLQRRSIGNVVSGDGDDENPAAIKLAAVAAVHMDKDIDKLRSQYDAAQIREASRGRAEDSTGNTQFRRGSPKGSKDSGRTGELGNFLGGRGLSRGYE